MQTTTVTYNAFIGLLIFISACFTFTTLTLVTFACLRLGTVNAADAADATNTVINNLNMFFYAITIAGITAFACIVIVCAIDVCITTMRARNRLAAVTATNCAPVEIHVTKESRAIDMEYEKIEQISDIEEDYQV